MAMTPLEDELQVEHEINVTPFIDVVLVLLIIFMVAAPLATVNVPVDLPATSGDQATPEKPIYLTLKQDHSLLLGDKSVAEDQLSSALNKATHGNQGRRIFIRADKAISYGDLMALLGRLRSSGYLQVGLVGMDQ